MITKRFTPEVKSVSGTTALAELDLFSGFGVSFHIEFGGNLVGTLKLQVKAKNSSTWVDVDDSAQAIGVGDTVFYNLPAIEADIIRPYFSHSSGTGNVTTHRTVKGP